MRKLLLPFSLLFRFGVAVRNWFFDIGLIKAVKIGKPVISVGNISAGGVGKTPLVEMLVEKISSGRKIAVVSRGYGRKSSGMIIAGDGNGSHAPVKETGDESGQITSKFPGVIVIADEKRVRGALKAVELGADVIILDDGFQHRYLHRDLDIVVMTAEEILKGDLLLPAGNRREPIGSLKRADHLVISRCDDVKQYESASQEILKQVSCAAANEGKITGLQVKIKSFKRAFDNENIDITQFAGKKVVAVSGIGSPDSFKSSLIKVGLSIAEHLLFPDHHWFSDEDIRNIVNTREKTNADFVVTTEKDFMRLKELYPDFLKNEPVIIAGISHEVVAGIDRFDDTLKKCVDNAKWQNEFYK
ncbi:MAG: tetraacyldisaccharide 4'-kinase [Bacteroidetes bacterium]|nr:tetraacyldisaccharide 4'-kinase [Bacteroidota bacterium]